MIYKWCTQCSDRSCVSENSHRASLAIKYRADFMLGGRYGKRIRKLFDNKKDAEAYEYVTLADFKRGTFLPLVKSKILFQEFFSSYQELYIKRYMKGWESEIYRFKRFLEMFKDRPLHLITSLDWEKYVSERLNQQIAKTTINRELTSCKIMFSWATKNSYLKTNPFIEIKKFKIDVIKTRWLDDKEIEDTLTACTETKDLDLRDILVFALNTGFRKANLKQVTAHDIVGQRIQATRTKSGKAYEVPINNELGLLLKRLISIRPSGPLLNFTGVKRRFRTVVKDSTISLHTFRHTFAAQCLKRGIPIDRVCAWMGHHSVEFTRQRYGHLCPNQELIEINLLNLGKTISPRSSNFGIRAKGEDGEFKSILD